jgi:nucleoporin NUP2
MNPSVSQNVVSFMGHDAGTSVPFKLRVKTKEQAAELKSALDREIEFVKSKSD